MIYPENFEQKIGFTAIREMLVHLCTFAPGAEEAANMAFTDKPKWIEARLDETYEMFRVLSDPSMAFPACAFYDVRDSLHRIHVEGLFLDETEVFDLRRTLEAVRQLLTFIQSLEENVYPALKSLARPVAPMEDINRRIDTILDKYGHIKDNASPELARIRKECQAAQGSVSRALNAILRQAQADGFVDKDVTPTMREGRLVIPVSPMYKRKIGGIVHDESATGKTVFIEPQQVVEANNRIRELEGEERREVVRILRDFTDFLRPLVPDVLQSQTFLGKIDFLRAKALLAKQLNSIRPVVLHEPLVEWEQAVHPLLFLSLGKQGKSVVPLNIRLTPEQRILLISGPNAGGKSVCLKTVALLQYMMQCGLMVTLHETSRMGIFERIFIDIGDEQSIEDDLSTYSSHLLNMKYFVRHSNARTLLLIDEFGGGTEPQIGGAIAEATLNRLNQNNAFGVITTHYTNLKHFAEDADGIVNGAMLYDRHLMRPIFQLEIGNPGSSFAVEIARKIGLPEDIIADAIGKVGAEHVDYDKHLQDIVRDKRYWEHKRQQIRIKEKQLEEKIAHYDAEMAQIKAKSHEITEQARQEARDILQQTNARIENTIRAIKEAQAEKERTRAARESLKQYERNLSDENGDNKSKKLLDTDKKRAEKAAAKAADKTLSAGMNARVKGQAVTGCILEIQGKSAIIAIGGLKSTVPLDKLEAVSNNQIRSAERTSRIAQHALAQNGSLSASQDTVRQRKLGFKHDIDVRGMRGDEALQAVTYFIDDAIMVSAGTVRILHGTGTGVLRQLIRQYLATVPGVHSFRDEHVQFGGAGITVVELE